MKVLKIFLLLFVTGLMFKNATAQTNASLNIVSANAGVVHQGATLDLTVSVTNTGANPISAQRVRVQISVPSAVGLPLATGSQNALSSNWIVTSNTAGGVITICNNTDAIPAGATRTSIVKISANTIGSGSINAGLAFGNGTSCTAFGSLTGDNTGDNSSSTPIVVTASQTCTLAASAAAGSINCFGGTTTITTTLTGRSTYTTDGGLTNPFYSAEYSLNGGAFQSSNTFTVDGSASPYTVSVREQGTTCTATAAAVTVNAPTALVAAAATTTISCNGGSSTVTVTATGGTAPYTGTGTFTVNAGAYSYTVTDANGCTSVASGTITQPTAIVVSATAPSITVFGGTTTVTVSATGGTSPYTGTGTFVRSAGTYTFTVTDANGCTGSQTITITQPTVADPAVGQMYVTNTSDVLQSANTLLFPPVYKLKVPFYNLNQLNTVPNGSIQVKVNLGSKLELDPAFTLATAPLSAYFTWTSAVVVDSVIITGTQIAGIPADFDAELVFNVKGKLSCTSNITSRILVVNTGAPVTDEDLQNNNAILQYTLPVTLTATKVDVTCNGLNNGIINAVASPGTTVVITNASNVVVSNTNLAPGTYTITATATGDAPLSNVCSSTTTATIVQPLVLVATNNAGATVNNICRGGNIGSLTVASSGGTAPYTYTIAGPTVNTTGATTGTFTSLLAGSYIVTSTDANGCSAATAAIIIGQPSGTAPDVSLGSDISSTLFATNGASKTIVYNITEIAGNPAVGDTIRITNPSGFTINFNSTLTSATVGGTTYVLDNSNWKIDNSNPAFTSIILTDPANAANPGTLLCNERKNVSITLTRNTTNISTFTLSARFRKANGELNLNNNLNSIILTAE
jgi:hypothetical protein